MENDTLKKLKEDPPLPRPVATPIPSSSLQHFIPLSSTTQSFTIDSLAGENDLISVLLWKIDNQSLVKFRRLFLCRRRDQILSPNGRLYYWYCYVAVA